MQYSWLLFIFLISWQDQAIVGVIDKSSRGRMPFGFPTLRSPLHPIGQRGLAKVAQLCIFASISDVLHKEL